jgi:regulator of cell morphogenesis and NO signaling
MQNLTARTVRDIALEMPQTTRVFESFKIDYCCGGRKMFLDACHNVGADPEKVLHEIENVLNADTAIDAAWLRSVSLTDLIDHILDKHHIFTSYELQNLPALMDKVARVHGDNHSELLEVRDLLTSLVDDLTMHMYKEENILFPYIKDIDAAVARGTSLRMPPFGTVQHPVSMMMAEHDSAGDILKQMRKVSNDYTLPEGACPSFTGLYNRFAALELDLHQHIHLENNALFPRAIELEETAFSTAY